MNYNFSNTFGVQFSNVENAHIQSIVNSNTTAIIRTKEIAQYIVSTYSLDVNDRNVFIFIKGVLGVAQLGANDSRRSQNLASAYGRLGWAVPQANGHRAPRTPRAPRTATPRTSAPVSTPRTLSQEVLDAIMPILSRNIASAPVEDRLPYTFGVEIELCGVTSVENFKTVCGQFGITVVGGRTNYNHRDSATDWKIVSDASITGDNAFELVSPVLKGADGMNQLHTVCNVLDGFGAKTNSSQGLHVHIGAKDFTPDQLRNVFVNFGMFEDAIKKCTWHSRVGGRWAASIKRYLTNVNATTASHATSTDDMANALRALVHYDRYHALNVEAYDRHKTIEFRQHQGTVNYEKISNWVYFVEALCKYSESNRATAPVSEINALPFASEELKAYYTLRNIFNANH